MEEASAAWAEELSRARNDIAQVKRNVSAIVSAVSEQQQEQAMAMASSEAAAAQHEQQQQQQQPIPDPVALLERLSNLESSLRSIEADCIDVCGRRSALGRDTADALVRNAALIRELGERAGCGGGGGGTDNTTTSSSIDATAGGMDVSWRESVEELARQRDLFVAATTASDAAAVAEGGAEISGGDGRFRGKAMVPAAEAKQTE
mmetsp:Transcript_30390/g.66800  ORF Transcript_30390/g.66800 Transcript_30390/m.66800 type:complete len:205 (+) Transcript_30390:103-717(+)